MKKYVTLLSVFFACAAYGAESGPEPIAATAPAQGDSPQAVCQSLISSAAQKDLAAVEKHSLAWGSQRKQQGKMKRFEKMHQDYLSKLEKLKCSSEVIAKDHAFVEAQSESGIKRLIPFVKTEEGWKFDAKTYMSFYGYPGKGKKGPM